MTVQLLELVHAVLYQAVPAIQLAAIAMLPVGHLKVFNCPKETNGSTNLREIATFFPMTECTK